jgi:hypothetical protein
MTNTNPPSRKPAAPARKPDALNEEFLTLAYQALDD